MHLVHKYYQTSLGLPLHIRIYLKLHLILISWFQLICRNTELISSTASLKAASISPQPPLRLQIDLTEPSIFWGHSWTTRQKKKTAGRLLSPTVGQTSRRTSRPWIPTAPWCRTPRAGVDVPSPTVGCWAGMRIWGWVGGRPWKKRSWVSLELSFQMLLRFSLSHI